MGTQKLFFFGSFEIPGICEKLLQTLQEGGFNMFNDSYLEPLTTSFQMACLFKQPFPSISRFAIIQLKPPFMNTLPEPNIAPEN